MEKYAFASQPVANPAAVVTGRNYRFTILGPLVLRYEWAADGIFEDRASTFAINRFFPAPEYDVRDSDHQLDITTPNFQVSYDKKRFSPNGLSVSFNSKVTCWGADWKFGSQPLHNLGGTAAAVAAAARRRERRVSILTNLMKRKEGIEHRNEGATLKFIFQAMRSHFLLLVMPHINILLFDNAPTRKGHNAGSTKKRTISHSFNCSTL
ncbi:hypothetical protein NQ176_g6986 [Zarea fungicola]|uniref:Uncharacterized protein n=1 Tax=Zarea fungicola TaxID=93591 RepID=A0ACC1N1F4_9HYPO|nr:hypothetical protein NQ176_g6986 [Lecanicillium fungicola]